MFVVAAEPVTRRWLGGIILSTVVAATAYLGVVLWVGRVQVVASMKLVGLATLTAVLALSLLNYALRFLRWHLYLRTLGSHVPLLHDLRVYLCGFALTTTPGKAGEMARSFWLHPYGVPASNSLAAFLTERFQDFLVILLLSSIGASFYQHARWLLVTGLGLVTLGCLFLLVPSISQTLLRPFARGRGRVAILTIRLLDILALSRKCLAPAQFGLGFFIGVCAWSAEAVGFYMVLGALGSPLHVTYAISIYALSMLAGGVSFMPGGLGGSEASMILLLKVSRVPLALAVSATVIIRLATLWFAVLIGIVALSIRTRMPTPQVVAGSPLPESI